MEDLDTPRVVPGVADDILRTLEAFSLHWDGEILWQSHRIDHYQAVFDELRSRGFIYPCGCSRAEIARLATAPHGREEIPYPGTCRNGLAPGKAARSFRVRVTDEVIFFRDGILGELSENLEESCGDFVVKRGDGLFAYQLAVVADDAASGVNQVVRGADLITSTPRQIHLQHLLGLDTPCYCHLPLVTGTGGEKLSKRDHAVSINAYGDLIRAAPGLLIRTLRFLGQTVPRDYHGLRCDEILCRASATFTPATIPRSPGPFPEDFA